jgi:hypothetical protein
MTIDADGVARLLERFGLPTIYLAALALLAWKFINGPAMVLAAKIGDGVGIVSKSFSTFLARLTVSLEATHLEHSDLRSHASTGVAEIKATITAESTAVREHVTEEVKALHTRIEATRGSIEAEVRQQTGEHAACATPMITPPRGLARTLPEGDATCAR